MFSTHVIINMGFFFCDSIFKSMFKHLKSTSMSYTQHFMQAMTYYYKIQKAALCVFLHAFWPDMFTTEASTIIKELASEFEQTSEDV